MIDAKTAEMLRNGELEYEDLSAPLPSGDVTGEHLASYAEHKGLDSRAQKLIYGICAGEKANGSVGRVTASGNRDRLQAEYDVDYDSLAEEARQWVPPLDSDRALSMLEGHEGAVATRSREEWEERAKENETESTAEETVNTSDEFVAKLDAYVEKHDLDYGDLTIVPNDDAEFLERLGDEMREHDLDTEDLCVARHADVKAIKDERDRLIGRVGIDSSDAERLSLDSLRAIAEKDSGVTETESLSPNPRSGDPQASSDETRYADPEKAEAIQARIDTLEENSSGGRLVKHAIDHWEQELAALEQ